MFIFFSQKKPTRNRTNNNNGTLKIVHCGKYYDSTTIICKTPLHDIKKAVKSARMERSGFKYIKHTRRWASQLTHLHSQTNAPDSIIPSIQLFIEQIIFKSEKPRVITHINFAINCHKIHEEATWWWELNEFINSSANRFLHKYTLTWVDFTRNNKTQIILNTTL